jgi:hypothetical protein
LFTFFHSLNALPAFSNLHLLVWAKLFISLKNFRVPRTAKNQFKKFQ